MTLTQIRNAIKYAKRKAMRCAKNAARARKQKYTGVAADWMQMREDWLDVAKDWETLLKLLEEDDD